MKYSVIASTLFLGILSLYSCSKDAVVDDPDPDDVTTVDPQTYNTDWTDLSHGNVTPDYTTVFPQSSVNQIEISIGTDKWNAIRTNMKALYGYDFGARAGAGGGFPNSESEYVDVTLKFNNKTWKNVGFRLKGNSSLSQAWGQGNYKLPFRLNFDKFEDTYPGIKNQHFYGFEELTFSPGIKDQSLIREKVAADIFRLAGVPAAQTAFYRVYIDFGAGLKYCGVYAGVEIPEDNMVKSQFGEEKGNIYKPESKLVSFVQSEFEKKNNEETPDYSDVQTFITALNSSLRTSNPAQWRSNLEQTFNVDHYLKYLAVNNAIVNWDVYGAMAHNFYLYNHTGKKLTWIPWDHNEALTGSPGISGSTSTGGGGGPGMGGGGQNALSLSMNEVGSSWPLLRYVADDATYMEKYKSYLKSFKDNVFTESAMNALFDKYHNLISPYVIGANGEQANYTHLTNSASFTSALASLKTHVSTRRALISTYVP